MVAHFPKLQRGQDIGFNHGPIDVRLSLSREEFDVIHLNGIVFGRSGRKDSKTAVYALRTTPAMGMHLGDFADAGAADRVLDQFSKTTLDDGLYNLCFRLPNERIVKFDGLARGRAKELAKILQCMRMCRARRPCADDLKADRQIDAQHPVFKEANASPSEQTGNRAGECGIEE